MSFLRIATSRIILVLALLAMGVALCAWLVPMEMRAVEEQFLGFPDSDVTMHQLRPVVLAGLCFMPALTALIYSFCGTLDRYIFRQFLVIFGVCLSTLYLIWLLIDLADKIGDFASSSHVIKTILLFYGTRLPSVLLLLLPYCLLFALLYALGKLSAQREIIAMIQSGRGVLRLSRVLIISGLLCVLFGLGLNFHWGPISEGTVDDILDEATGKKPTEATQVLFRNPDKHRLWMIGAFPPDYQNGEPLDDVEVTITDDREQLVSRLFANRARWSRENRQWTFEGAVLGIYQTGRAPAFQRLTTPLVIDSWSETPWQLIKPGLSPAHLGVPDLQTWLAANAVLHSSADPAPYLTQWHYRWALPFSCLVTVLLATPLGVYFSRRGSVGGVFFAVVLSAFMLLTGTVVLAFGESGMLHPALAAWLPNLFFSLIGIYLFHRRITGRPIYHPIRKLFSRDS